MLHRNIPNLLSQITSAISAENINIENMANRSKKDYAYTIVEITGDVPAAVVEKIAAIDGVIRTNIIK